MATRGTAQKLTAKLTAQAGFSLVRSSPLTPGPGSQEDPKSKSRVTQVFMLPDSKRDSDAKDVGGQGGRKQKEKSGLPRPSYLGSLMVSRSRLRGSPGLAPREAVFQEICSLPPWRGGKSKEQSLAASPAPPAGGLVYIPSTSKPPAAPLGGPGLPSTCKDPPREGRGPELGSSK